MVKYAVWDSMSSITVSSGEKQYWLNPNSEMLFSEPKKRNEQHGDNVFTAQEGFRIISHSSSWPKERLEEIYEELKNNRHGYEIENIKEIILHGEPNPVSSGVYTKSIDYYAVEFVFPAFYSTRDGLGYTVEAVGGIIELYDCDQLKTIDELARTIAHEYGHHFSYCYFGEIFGDHWQSSEYYAIRNLDKHENVRPYDDYDEYLENHMWDIKEIAAEDYVQLLGSPTIRRTREFMDIQGLNNYWSQNPSASNETLWRNHKAIGNIYMNVWAQENIFLPLAWEVESLPDYFTAIIDGSSNVDYR